MHAFLKQVQLKNNKKVTLRLIESTDINGIWKNFNDVVDEGIYLPAFTRVTSEWEKTNWFQELLLNNNFCIVAIDQKNDSTQTVVGQCTIEKLEWEAGDHVGILGILIQKEYRNIGLGQALIKVAIEEARRRGKQKLILSTFATNQMGIALYQRCGFHIVGRYYKQYKMRDGFVDEILMENWIGNTI
jgi:ribosomal protein S18 acetylase RimI-like enzyme